MDAWREGGREGVTEEGMERLRDGGREGGEKSIERGRRGKGKRTQQVRGKSK